MKKFVALLLSLAVGLSVVPSTLAAEYPASNMDRFFPKDLPEDFWAYEDIDLFLATEIISGSKDKNGDVLVKPNDQVTRAQFSKILVNALNLVEVPENRKAFPDVEENSWYYPYINTVSSLGIVNGKPDGTFKPNDYITRDQMISMIFNAFPYIQRTQPVYDIYKDVPRGYWAETAINKANSMGIVNGYEGYFKPRAFSTRAQAIVMLRRALGRDIEEAPELYEITRTMREMLYEDSRIYESGDYLALKPFYEKTAHGYYKEYSLYWMEQWNNYKENGSVTSFSYTNNFSADAIQLTNRFAIFSIVGNNYNYIKDAKSYSAKMDGEFFLIKDREGNWKIFNYYPYE